MKLKALDIVLFVYGGMILIGGAMGYVMAKSLMSLISALVIEMIVTTGVLVAQKNRSLGYGVCLFAAVGTLAFFTYRFSTTGNAMPALPAIAMSVIVIALLVQAHFSARNQ
ncbi:MAG: TMEM14 family protein [Fimbriimonadales bacterium]